MESLRDQPKAIEQAGEDLFNFAVDREDMKSLLEYLPGVVDIVRSKVEYELVILRMISVGWSISYFLENRSHKDLLAELYWKAVYEFSRSISSSAGLMIGRDIDYFQVIRDRLDTYVETMRRRPDAAGPAVVIGPEFARVCGNENDVQLILVGAKMFMTTMDGVKKYLEHMFDRI
jgi:hypothetical protein